MNIVEMHKKQPMTDSLIVANYLEGHKVVWNEVNGDLRLKNEKE